MTRALTGPGVAVAAGTLLVSLAASQLAAQIPDPVTRQEISASVLQPQPLAPTDARLQALQMPDGFQIRRFAEGLDNPRILRAGPNGALYVTQRNAGNLVLLQDTNGDGVADVQRVVLEDVPHLHAIEIRGSTMYLSAIHELWSADIEANGEVGTLQRILDDLPDAGQHPNRTMRFGPDNMLYYSVGSTCNACREPNPENAALLRIDVESGDREIFAAGLRNTIGFGWHPQSGRLFGMDHQTDWLGDDRPVEALNEIIEYGRYGWPFTYFDGEQLQFMPHREPLFVSQELWLENTEVPLLGYTAHAAPMDMVYYTGQMFPAEYRNDAFVAMRGSWNRDPAVGYEIVRVRFDDAGEPFEIVPFVSGFLVEDAATGPAGDTPGYLGRPVGLLVLDDGSLLVSDDSNDTIYRITFGEQAATPPPQMLAREIFAEAPDTIEVSSPAFAANGAIDFRFTDYGEGTSPPLSWQGLPEGTQSVVLMMEDPEAVAPLPFVHWLIANIPVDEGALPEGVEQAFEPAEPSGAIQGSNSNSATGYFGPRTPPGEGPHPYHFQVFALDRELDLPEGFNRKAMLDAMVGHVLARGELVATFEMPRPEEGIGPEAEEDALLEVPGWDPEGDAPGL